MGRHEEFIGAVKHRARLLSTVQTEHAVRATLQAVAGLIPCHLVRALAAELPAGIGRHLRPAGTPPTVVGPTVVGPTVVGPTVVGTAFDRRRFILRVAQQTELDEPDAAFVCRAVFERLNATLTANLMTDVRRVLPQTLCGLATATAPVEDATPAPAAPRNIRWLDVREMAPAMLPGPAPARTRAPALAARQAGPTRDRGVPLPV